ncbi:hypothetical protein [Corynebacterium sp. 335C]
MTGGPGGASREGREGLPDGGAAWLHLDFTGGAGGTGAAGAGASGVPDDAAVLESPGRADPAIVGEALADVMGTGDDIHDTVRMLGGLAGLERMAVWWRARALADATGGPVVVDCSGGGPEAELARLRLLAAPGELAGLIDAVAPRVDRHRQMPAVFGERAGRARALELLWGRCTDFDRSVFGGGAVVHVAGAPHAWAGAGAGADAGAGPDAGTGGAAVADAAAFLGLPVVRGGRPADPEPPRLRADGADDDGTLRFTWRIPLPGRLAEETGCGADVRGRDLVAWAGPWWRRMTLPAVLGACAHDGTDVVTRTAEPVAHRAADSGTAPGGDILVRFRSVAGLLPGGQ